jgi:hypothetical protein
MMEAAVCLASLHERIRARVRLCTDVRVVVCSSSARDQNATTAADKDVINDTPSCGGATSAST